MAGLIIESAGDSKSAVVVDGVPLREARAHPSLSRRTPEGDVRSAQRDGRTTQASLLVMAPIKPDRLEALQALLRDVVAPPAGEDLEDNPVIPFGRIETIHFARILIHDASPSAAAPIPEWNGEPQVSGEPIPATLLFATDYDGALADHLDELLRVAGPGLTALFENCEGWPGHQDPARAHQFFARHRVASNTFYTGTMKRSVAQIRREAELRDYVEAYLDAFAGTPDFPTEPVKIREHLRAHVLGQALFAWTKVEPGPFPSMAVPRLILEHPAPAALVVVVLTAALSFAVPPRLALALVWVAVAAAIAGYAAYRYLCYLAARDPVIIREDVQNHTAGLADAEDRIVQNQMSSVIYIKRPLWFRRTVLKAVLSVIDLSARYISNEGSLAGIPSIHFARWVVVDKGRRLVFFSNFDGSWENYLGDFIDKAHGGLTAVWSHCVGFPRTVGLAGNGATDEQRFKAYSRQSQIHTQVWYSACRWLSVSNINDNSRLRLGLYGEMNDAEAAAWLRMATPRGEQAPERPAPSIAPAVELDDVQGLVVRSYAPLGEAIYVPASLDRHNRTAARAWVADLLPAITPASHSSETVKATGRAVNVAFTYGGLSAFGIEDMGVTGFSREFTEGMAEGHRQCVLGDTGPADPSRWRWGGPQNADVDAMLFLYADSPEHLTDLYLEQQLRASRYGVTLGAPLDSIMLPEGKEHFGFHDGIAQPRIAGLKGDGGAPADAASLIPSGEVILGYPNAYGIIPASPTVSDRFRASALLAESPGDPAASRDAGRRDLGRNGSYVVFRQLRQDVKAFWEFVDRSAGLDAQRRKLIAAKMVGRWPNGAPLVKYPTSEPAAYDVQKANDFWYKDDLAGDRCPVGSHIRRSNPRDGLRANRADSLVVSNRHRLLRRGRAYGAPLAASLDPDDFLRAPDQSDDRGLHFICFNTDLARQFELVQNTWINSMKFDGLYADPDPIVAPHIPPSDARHPEAVSNFTIQACPVRHRVSKLPPFVTMVGGAYLFMPGLRALRFLAEPDHMGSSALGP